jgi:hypothetical protein
VARPAPAPKEPKAPEAPKAPAKLQGSPGVAKKPGPVGRVETKKSVGAVEGVGGGGRPEGTREAVKALERREVSAYFGKFRTGKLADTAARSRATRQAQRGAFGAGARRLSLRSASAADAEKRLVTIARSLGGGTCDLSSLRPADKPVGKAEAGKPGGRSSRVSAPATRPKPTSATRTPKKVAPGAPKTEPGPQSGAERGPGAVAGANVAPAAPTREKAASEGKARILVLYLPPEKLGAFKQALALWSGAETGRRSGAKVVAGRSDRAEVLESLTAAKGGKQEGAAESELRKLLKDAAGQALPGKKETAKRFAARAAPGYVLVVIQLEEEVAPQPAEKK